MKPILLIACASLLAPAAAEAGNWSLEFSYGSPGYKRLAAASHRACRDIWVPAHYDFVKRPVVIPAVTARRFQPAVYEWVYDRCGRRRRVCVQPAGYCTVIVRPARTVYRTERVFVRGHYESTCKPGCEKARAKHRGHKHRADHGRRGKHRQEIRRRDRRGGRISHGYGVHVRYEQ